MKFEEKLINLINENFNSQAQKLIAKDFADYVWETNPFDQTNYESLIKEVLESGASPEGTNVMEKEAIQYCFINALQKKGVDPFEEIRNGGIKMKNDIEQAKKESY